VTIAAALFALGRGDDEAALQGRSGDGAVARVPPEATRADDGSIEAAPVDSSAPGALPASLRGTDVPGGFFVDDDGRFVPTRDALDVFDYYLAASGEEPASVLRARIEAHIRASLEGEAAREAEALLDTYLGFRGALRELAESEAPPPHDLERRLQWIRELRRAHFGATTADALFGEEERALAIDLERRRVHDDPALDASERAERLAALEAELPPEVRTARARARGPMRLHQRTRAMREAGASDEEIFEARAAEFGSEAAERLALLDAERAAWQARLDAYMQARDALLSELDGASAEERSEAVEALRAARFDAHERRRVQALEGAWPASG
jgi:lipase chaperone LimK